MKQRCRFTNDYATFLSLCKQKLNNNSAVKIKLEVLSKDEGFNPTRSLATETVRRYKEIDKILAKCIGENIALIKRNFTKRIDDLLLHPVLGYLFFLLVLFFVFQAIFSWSQLPMEWIDNGFSFFSNWVATNLPQGMLNDLIVNGILAGLGGIMILNLVSVLPVLSVNSLEVSKAFDKLLTSDEVTGVVPPVP